MKTTQNKTKVLSACSAGLILFATSASAAVRVNLSTPPSSECVDTESSVTMPLSGWDDLTRHVDLTFDIAVTNTEAYCIQCAFGTDANADGDLAPEETGLIVGFDCGAWFVRNVDAAPLPRQSEVGVSIRRDEGVASTATTFDLYPVFDRTWNAVKVTTRGRVVPDTSIAARFRNSPAVIILR